MKFKSGDRVRLKPFGDVKEEFGEVLGVDYSHENIYVINIGLNTVGHTGINACGDGSLELSLKQEKEYLEN